MTSNDQGDQRFRALFETTLNAVFLTDEQQHCVDVNPSACELLGRTREEILTMKLSDVVIAAPGQVDARVAQLLAQRRERGLVRVLRKDQTTRVVEFSAVANMLPGVNLYVLQDVTERHAIERELRERTARYDLIVEGVRDGIWDWDIPNKRVFLSPQWKHLRGYEDSEFGQHYRDWSEGIHPDDAQRVHEALQAHVKGQSASFDEEYRVRCKDGTWKWVHDRGIAQRDASGRALRMAGAETDITERKRAEAVLQRRDQELLESQRLGNIGSWLWEIETNRYEWSEQRYRIFGLDPSTAPSQRATDQEKLFAPESWGRVDAARRALLSHGTPYQVQAQIVRPDGVRRWVVLHGESERDSAGSVTKYRGTVQDITEQRAADLERLEALRRLRDVSSQLDMVMSVAGLGVSRHDLRTGVSYFCDSLLAMLGLQPRPEGVSVQDGSDMIHPDDLGRFIDGRNECLRLGVSSLCEFRGRHADGSWRHMVGRRVLVRDALGEPESVMHLMLDVTEQRQAEDAVRAKEQAVQANRAKSEFLSRMSHELRTPLNAVLGFSDLLLQDTRAPLAQHQTEQLGHVRSAGQHLLRLIDNLLDISRIESDSLQLRMEQVDAKAVFAQTLTDLTQLASASHVKLQLQVVGEVAPVLTTDMTRLRQIAYNLVSNAIKYNRPEGSVTVGINTLLAHWQLQVSDTGIGMDEQQLAKLYRPFERLGQERTTVAGVGIGLAITRDIVQRLGGELGVSSQVGVGTVFTLTLPWTVNDSTH